MVDTPTYEQVRSLALLGELTAPGEFEDANGHISITGHLASHERASWTWIEELGFHSDAAPSRYGIMDLEHHLRYLAELRIGTQLAVHLRWLGVARRVVHGMTFAVDLDERELVSTLEFTSVHVDLERRRAVAFPDTVGARIEALLAADEQRDWQAPVCGAMGLTRR